MSTRRFRARGNGLDLSVVEWGGGPVTCVLLHGFADAAASFDLVAPALAASGLRVLAPDLRGFGESDRVPRGGYYHFPDYVADVDALVRAHAPDPFLLVGHSMGGTVATMFAGARPECVRKLALLEGVGPPDHAPSIAPLRARKWLEDLAAPPEPAKMTEAEALARLAATHPRVPRDVLASRLPHLFADGAWRHDALHRTTSPTPFFADVYRAYAARVACPVLYVSGGALGWRVPDEDARLAAFADVKHVDLADAGHMMHWTKPGEAAGVLVEFLT